MMDFFKQPRFDMSQLSLLDLFLLFGVLIAVSVSWALIIRTGTQITG